MRKLILFIACSLDGYIARSDGAIDWLFTDADYGYTEFFASVDTVVMGRITYETALKLESTPFQGKAAFVFSRTRSGPDAAGAMFVSGAVERVINSVRNRSGGDVWLVGGGDLVRQFLAADLIDEFVVSIHPTLLGAGLPLFPAPFPARDLLLLSSVSFPSGLAQLRYQRRRAQPVAG